MDFFDLLRFIGGVALFLYGMNVMGGALEKQAGGGLKLVLERITSNPIKGVLLGTIITAIIQSSSATMVMVVGLVNSGIMCVENSLGIIMGSNIGTTATGWILSLTGIDGTGSFLLRMCKPSSFVPILAAVGVCLRMFDKSSDKRKDIGTIMLGFSVLMFGMETMSDAMSKLSDMPGFLNILTMFKNPILGVVAGIVVTALIQSVSASVGILQAMAVTGAVSYGIAIPLIMGMSIGASTPVLVSAVGANTDAKRSSMLYLLFNVFGTVACMVLFYVLDAIFDFALVDQTASVVGVALTNTVFKVASTVILLPFNRLLLRVAGLCVKDKEHNYGEIVLDERFLNNPAFAVSQCRDLTMEMSEMSRYTLLDALKLVGNYTEQGGKRIVSAEDEVDHFEDVLGTFMVKLSARSLRMEDSREISRLLHCIGDFERISDHALNIKETAEEIQTKNLNFSDEAQKEMDILFDAVREIVNTAVDAFNCDDVSVAKRVEPLEAVIDELVDAMKSHHIMRLQKGACTMLQGFVFSDLLTNCERVADHCSNIGIAIIETANNSFETHGYLNRLTASNDEEYTALYADYALKYNIDF